MIYLTLDLLLRCALISAITAGAAYLTSLLYLRLDLQLASSLPCSILLGLLLGLLLTKLPSPLDLLQTSEALSHYKNKNFWLTTTLCLISFIILSSLAYRDTYHWNHLKIAREISVLDIPDTYLQDSTYRVFSPHAFRFDRTQIGYRYTPARSKSSSAHTFAARLIDRQTDTPSDLWLVQVIHHGDNAARSDKQQLFLRTIERLENTPNHLLSLPPEPPWRATDALQSLGISPNTRTLFIEPLEDLERARSLAHTKLRGVILFAALVYLALSLVFMLSDAHNIIQEQSSDSS